MNAAGGTRRVLAGALAAAALLGMAAGCAQPSRVPPPEVPGGDPLHGAELVIDYGCSSCHVVAGIPEADGVVGPSLTEINEQAYVAGVLPMSGPNLERWIRDPQSIKSGSAMPNLGVTEQDARDIAAYLFGQP